MQKVNGNKTQSGETPLSLLTLIRSRYLPYWPLFIVAVAAALAGAFLYLRYATPLYKVSGVLLVQEASNGLGASDMLQSLDLMSGSKTIMENEIEILKSRTLTKAVIRNLNLYGEVIEKGKIRDVVLYKDSPLKFTFLEPESIEMAATGIWPFTCNEAAKQVVIDGKKYPIGDTVQTRWGKLLIQSGARHMDTSASYTLHVMTEKQWIQLLLATMKIMPAAKAGSVVDLEYTDAAPERGEDIVNELIRVYNKAAVDDKNRTSANTMNFVEERLRIVSAELGQAETQVEHFKTAQGIVDIGEQSKLFLASVQENDRKISEANMQLSVLDAIEKYVNNQDPNGNIVPGTIGLTDAVLLELVTKLSETALQLERLRKTTGENSPLLASLTRQMERLKPAIRENIGSLRANLEAGLTRLQAENSRNMGIIRSVPGKEKALLEVSRQQVIKNNIYTFLLEKREETALAYAAAVSDSRIVDAAESAAYPFSPQKPLVLGISVLGAIALVVGFVSLKDMMNREVMFRADIEKVTTAPIAAEIMHHDGKDPLVMHSNSRTAVAEQFRALRTSLSYIGLNGDRKTLLITSSISGEGKSFISVNLAMSLSLAGKKVALLEFDLRKPMISKMLDMRIDPGISNYLVGKASLQDILKKIGDSGLLYLVPAGIMPPNPSELILNGQLEHLLNELKERFDYIIIDSAPVGLVTDARLIAPFCDATLYVVRHQRTPKHYLKLVEELYQNRELGKLNIVFNGIKRQGVAGYGYGSGYGDINGYGYTEVSKKPGLFKRSTK
ncbi:polysaccharide biosynthesis tyrosine autokinase [Chitinophaga polysaccharea]|uniref:GumC family protein n=1 Tax=Chitinophaga polysaccharea TaxID=1293035 RepID=UPI0014557013|nr:polysaccharide biosynthesis tyrosine autokinase [Chitinophaga polysaccharea]NLR60556.1 polysaccharide biosynthesis tyrosine autokinase [Chitinophaga polysaccharea]